MTCRRRRTRYQLGRTYRSSTSPIRNSTTPAPNWSRRRRSSFGVNPPYIGREAQLGPVCSDSPNPRDPASYPAQAAFATARSGVVGPRWAWADEGCARWPVLSADRYAGPWNHPTAAPILVVNTTVDPATPYRDAVAMTHDLANARLLTVNGYGDSTLTNHSTCANAIEDAYFVTGALPRPHGLPAGPGSVPRVTRSSTPVMNPSSHG